jgi:hypothetical protein
LHSQRSGATELRDDHGNKKMFERDKWSLFAPLLNTTHRLINGSREPARHLAVRYGSRIHPLGFKVSHQKTDDDVFRGIDESGW